MWQRIKGKQIEGLKFRRQFGVGPYVLDFCCPELRLAIELDGQIHNTFWAERHDDGGQVGSEQHSSSPESGEVRWGLNSIVPPLSQGRLGGV